ncbi:gliding motility-associated C-terminal domain-containing protein [Flavobacterium gawalongense]|uniref:Gliding motility-associated C-terminal domain-containing protein n=1 Tax=Flavobacterium gawalongense TaxID=2594432 RepID=A0ABY3CHP6_9FLAO|nr:gliding motility-associated C-terminal domain-containing protein [Flavobacterium gawalongense]TRW99740.1 gliding motility-associated C-terminal domain-containing protein [Flavobacterium gawalongense]TRX03873.1 gliding motility-associated C-terminal domain-containing protein [Flavobacterium gawalongense]TRX07605.1 gliding motility-associated C-terminal domain-containing protein [Flavobacterium gawalongense]TRX23481.1 gliding motility-associated C-terminal domain-containing protein [Flavobacte
MKNKLLLFLLLHLLLGHKLIAGNFVDILKVPKMNLELLIRNNITDTIKKHKKTSRLARSIAILPPPSTTAGSSCGDGINPVQVNVYAYGANGSDIIQWFSSQTSISPIFTGSVFSPSISTTKTYYVQSKSGNDISIRIPVVASVYLAPPAVTLIATPANDVTNPLCLGTSVTFTAAGGADLFEFSVDGVVQQAMSVSKTYTTNALTNGQTVSVRTRYAVSLDGAISESAWGTAAMEDNFLSAPLSGNATTGYINSLKISPIEDKLVFGIAGKLLNYRKVLLFLDTKPGGFNVSNYGDEIGSLPAVNGFNFFNNNPSIFDSYFQADYCLTISTDVGETDYYADVIELKTGNSIKTSLGSAATGSPSAVMGINKNNIGISDYNLGFEIEVLKSLIGYTTGDIKFFALTMQDNDISNYNVTNSFLSPERSSGLDYGSGAIDYNLKDPNPVVVAASALTPCYSQANITMDFVSIPTMVSVVQPTCALQSGAITIATQSGVEYSVNGTIYQASNSFTGLAPNDYTLYVRKIADNSCVTLSSTAITINSIPTPPVDPTASSVVQPTCAIPSGTITIAAQSGVEYSVNGTIYQTSNTFTGLAPNNYTLYVRNIADNTCTSSSSTAITINAIPTAPVVPTMASVVQPTCAIPSGTITIAIQSGVEYSVNGTIYQASNTFAGLAPNSYTLYVRNTANITCVTSSSSAITINTIPNQPAVPTTTSVVQPTCTLQSGTIAIATQSGVEYSVNGTIYQASNTFTGLAPNNYTLYVRNIADNSCVTLSSTAITINAIPTAPVIPTMASVIQPTCAIPSGTITIAVQSGVEYSVNGTIYQTSNAFTGLAPNNYILYVRNIADNTCVTSSSAAITINAIPTAPVVPTATSVIQPTCGTPSGSIVITTQSGVEYSLNGTTYQSSNTFTGLARADYTLYVRNIADNTCITPSASTITINAIPNPPITPTATSVIQPTCGTPSGSIVITTQSGVEYSLNGTTYQSSNTFTGLATSDYTLYIRNIADNTCITLSASAITINPIPTPPIIPTMVSADQPTCAVPSGTIVVAAQSGVEYSLNGATYQTSNTFSGLAPNNYILYVRNIADNTCSAQSVASVTIDPLPPLPSIPTLAQITQPTCLQPMGRIQITAQANVQYSLGNGYQDNPEFLNLAPGKYTMSVRFTNSIACISTGSQITINPIPPEIQFEISGDCESRDYVLTVIPIASSYDSSNVDYQWKDSTGAPVGTNSNVLNVSDVIASTPGQEVFPIKYSLTVKSIATGCETTDNVTIESIYCNIQKGISPDGNGSNDYFDLRLMDVKNLEIFDRYGIKVYSQTNYTDQWKGQSDKGDELPSATYYYVIEFNNGQTKTGWIYLIREK